MTEQEKDLIRKTMDVWEDYMRLPVEMPNDQADFCQMIRQIQAHIMCRDVRRQINCANKVS